MGFTRPQSSKSGSVVPDQYWRKEHGMRAGNDTIESLLVLLQQGHKTFIRTSPELNLVHIGILSLAIFVFTYWIETHLSNAR